VEAVPFGPHPILDANLSVFEGSLGAKAIPTFPEINKARFMTTSKYVVGVLVSAFLGFWGAQAIIYFYSSQLGFEPNAGKRRRNLLSAIKVSTGTALIVSVAWFLQQYILD